MTEAKAGRLTRRAFLAGAAAIGAATAWAGTPKRSRAKWVARRDLFAEGVASGDPTSDSEDGGPLRYRVVHRVPMWRAGETPRLARRVVEGDHGLAL